MTLIFIAMILAVASAYTGYRGFRGDRFLPRHALPKVRVANVAETSGNASPGTGIDHAPATKAPPVTNRPASTSLAAVATPHLVRSLAIDGLAPTFVQKEDGPLLTGMAMRANNVGPDMLHWHIEQSRLYVDNIEVFNAPGNQWTYLSPSQSSEATAPILNPIAIKQGTASLTILVKIKYDTEPKTGYRTSYRKINYPLSWDSTTLSMHTGNIIEQKEY